MMKQIKRYVPLMGYMLLTEIKTLRETLFDSVVDLFIWISAMIVLHTYFLPEFGLSENYINFFVPSLVAGAALFGMLSNVVDVVGDLEGRKVINYYLTLPMPSWLVFIRNILFYTLNNMLMALLVLPLSKLILQGRLDLSKLNIAQFVCMFVIANLFYGSFAIWLSSYIKNTKQIRSAWMRMLFPLVMLGGFQFSWYVMYDLSPRIAQSLFANPILYVMEGSHAAMLGQQGFLNIWLCAWALIVFTIFFTVHGIYRFKRRLDF